MFYFCSVNLFYFNIIGKRLWGGSNWTEKLCVLKFYCLKNKINIQFPIMGPWRGIWNLRTIILGRKANVSSLWEWIHSFQSSVFILRSDKDQRNFSLVYNSTLMTCITSELVCFLMLCLIWPVYVACFHLCFFQRRNKAQKVIYNCTITNATVKIKLCNLNTLHILYNSYCYSNCVVYCYVLIWQKLSVLFIFDL